MGFTNSLPPLNGRLCLTNKGDLKVKFGFFLIAVIMLCIGIARIIKPVPKLKLSRRNAARLVAVAYIILFFIFGDEAKYEMLCFAGTVSLLVGVASLIIPIKAIGIKDRGIGAIVIVAALGLITISTFLFEKVHDSHELVWNAREEKEAKRKADDEIKKQVEAKREEIKQKAEAEEKLKTENPTAYTKLIEEREQARKAEEARKAEVARKQAEIKADMEKKAQEEAKRKEIETHPAIFKMLRWYKGGFENVFLLDAKITNIASFPIKDISIYCRVYSESHTQLNTVANIAYKMIPPGKSIILHQFNMGFMDAQGSNAECDVVDYARVR